MNRTFLLFGLAMLIAGLFAFRPRVAQAFPFLAVPAISSAKPHLAVNSYPPAFTYIVSEPASFPVLPVPTKPLVVLNGSVLTPNVDYTITGRSMRIRLMRADGTPFLSQGDRITIFDFSGS